VAPPSTVESWRQWRSAYPVSRLSTAAPQWTHGDGPSRVGCRLRRRAAYPRRRPVSRLWAPSLFALVGRLPDGRFGRTADGRPTRTAGRTAARTRPRPGRPATSRAEQSWFGRMADGCLALVSVGLGFGCQPSLLGSVAPLSLLSDLVPFQKFADLGSFFYLTCSSRRNRAHPHIE
jgi:hypothetical protein